MGIENPNIGQILDASLDKEPEIRAAGDVLTSDFEKNLNSMGLTLENQVEVNPPNPSSLFPLINHRLTEVGNGISLTDSSQLENLVNNPSFQSHIDTQTMMVETLRTFDTFGGTPMSPVPYEEFEAITAITNTDQGPVVASAIKHTPTNIIYLFNQNNTEDSAYIFFPKGSELGFAKQSEGGFARIVPTIKFEDSRTEVITTDYMNALEGGSTNPPTYYQQDIENLEDITTIISTKITQPDNTTPNTFSIEIQPTDEITSSDQLATFRQPENLANRYGLINISIDETHPGYTLVSPDGSEIEVDMQPIYINEKGETIVRPDLGIYKTFNSEQNENDAEAFHISGVITKIESRVLYISSYQDPSVILEIPTLTVQLAVPLKNGSKVFLNGNYYKVKPESKFKVTPDNKNGPLAQWRDISVNLVPGMNVIAIAAFPIRPQVIENVFLDVGKTCDLEKCQPLQAYESYNLHDLHLIEQISNGDYTNIQNNQEINFDFVGFISSSLFKKLQ